LRSITRSLCDPGSDPASRSAASPPGAPSPGSVANRGPGGPSGQSDPAPRRLTRSRRTGAAATPTRAGGMRDLRANPLNEGPPRDVGWPWESALERLRDSAWGGRPRPSQKYTCLTRAPRSARPWFPRRAVDTSPTTAPPHRRLLTDKGRRRLVRAVRLPPGHAELGS
jgi:hypothetical protein